MITVIVLLILAAISITMLTGDNSILKRAVDAKERTERAEIIESAKTDILGQIAENKGKNITKEQLAIILNKQFKNVDENTIPDDILNNDMKLTTIDEKYAINLSEIYNGRFSKSNKTKFVEKLDSKTHGFGDYTKIQKIERATIEPDERFRQEVNLVSSNDSQNEIYMWNDNNVLYWYSIAENPELPKDSKQLFAGFESLLDVNGIKDFNTSNVTNMSNMFGSCYNLKGIDLSNWNMGNVTNMSNMFNGCLNLKSIDLSNWNTGNVTNMSAMFNACLVLENLDLLSFNTSNVTNTSSMFRYCKELQKIKVSQNFKVESVSDSTQMFENCISLVGESGTTFDSSKIDKTMAHIDNPENPGYFSSN